MKKKISFSAAISIVFVAMTVTFSLTMVLSARMFESKVASVNEKEAMYEKIADIDKVVRQNFYTQIDDTSIYNNLAKGYIAGLKDGESKYYTSEEVAVLQELSKGKLIGIGVDVTKSKENSGYLKVYKVYEGSPADAEGIVSGDLITAIDGIDMKSISAEVAKDMLTGQSGTTVKIKYMHESTEKEVDLVHKIYDAPSVTYSLEDGIGYIKITSFNSKTASELEYAANNLIDQNASSLCIDVRNNKSKEFEFAAQAADVLLKEGTTMFAQYNDGQKKVLYTSDKTAVTVPIVVVVNSSTGYASELFACMLKDISSAKLVGTKTMGKGTIQKLFRLPDGSGVDVTVGVLIPVTSAVYNDVGLIPDYEKILEADQELNFYALSISEDPQIQRAFEVAKNLVK